METSVVDNVFVQTPCEALRPFVKRFLVVEYPAAHRDSHLPDTGLVAAFHFKGESVLYGTTRAPQAALTGVWDRARSHEHSGNSGIVLASFTATGAAALLRCPADEFFNTTLALDDVLGRPGDLNRVHELLVEAGSHMHRIQAVEDFLLTLASNARPDALVSAAVSKIRETQGMMRIEDLARHVCLSQRALERRFRQAAGAPPKKFASIVRLRHVLRLRATGADFTSIAYAAGYCDQPHFIKDFKQITGSSPESFFNSR